MPVRIIIGSQWPQTGVFGGATGGRCGKIGRWRRGSAGQTIINVCYFLLKQQSRCHFFRKCKIRSLAE